MGSSFTISRNFGKFWFSGINEARNRIRVSSLKTKKYIQWMLLVYSKYIKILLKWRKYYEAMVKRNIAVNVRGIFSILNKF